MEGFRTGVAVMRGTSDVVELGWQLGFGFEAKLAWGCMGGRRSLEGVRFKLEIKFVFS
jgi:hypothetical protein